MAETKKKATTAKKAEEKTETAKAKKPAAKKAPAKKAAAPKAEEKAEKKAVKEEARAAKAEAKATKKAAKKPVEAKPVKPAVTEAHAFARDVRVTPRKARLVIDLVRGKDVDYSLKMLARLNKAAATPVAKLIKSAASNATNNFGMSYDRLYVSMIQASDGIKMKRYLPRAKGSSSSLVKRTSNISVTVKERN